MNTNTNALIVAVRMNPATAPARFWRVLIGIPLRSPSPGCDREIVA